MQCTIAAAGIRQLCGMVAFITCVFACVLEPVCSLDTFLLPPQTLPDAAFDPLARFEGPLRLLPLAAGVAGIAGTLLNRVLSGVRTLEH